MTCRHTLALSILLAAAGVAKAQCVGMTPGATARIQFLNSNTPCPVAALGVNQLPDPSPNYCENTTACNAGRVLLANADNRANRLRSCSHMERGSLPFLYNSMVDTYTIAGPSGTNGTPVTFRVRCHVVGVIYSSFHTFVGSNPVFLMGGSLTFDVGNWAPATNADFLEQFRVNPFTPDFTFSVSMGQAQTSTPRSLPVDQTIDQPLDRTVGQPFDIGYQITSSVGTLGNVAGATSPPDAAYLVATINFDLPAGYTITSTKGWTNPDAPPCDPDVNQDGNVDQDDVVYLVNVVGGGPNPTNIDPDFNHDGNIDQDDVTALVNVTAGGPCP